MICPGVNATLSLLTPMLGIMAFLLLLYFCKELQSTLAILSQKEQRKHPEVGISYGFYEMEGLQQVAS